MFIPTNYRKIWKKWTQIDENCLWKAVLRNLLRRKLVRMKIVMKFYLWRKKRLKRRKRKRKKRKNPKRKNIRQVIPRQILKVKTTKGLKNRRKTSINIVEMIDDRDHDLQIVKDQEMIAIETKGKEIEIIIKVVLIIEGPGLGPEIETEIRDLIIEGDHLREIFVKTQ